jgi:hypothetical protein
VTTARHTVLSHEFLEQGAGPVLIVGNFVLQGGGHRQSAHVPDGEGDRHPDPQGKPFDVTVELPRENNRGFQGRAHEIMLLGRNENGFERHGALPSVWSAILFKLWAGCCLAIPPPESWLWLMSLRPSVGQCGNQCHGGKHGNDHGDACGPASGIPGKPRQKGTHAAANIECSHV